MAASGSLPALAAPDVHAAVDSLPALAAPESAQIRYTLAQALQYRYKINNRPSSIGHTRDVQIQVRKKGNAATHYYRKLFTLKDGTPLVKFIDFSHAERCKIIYIGLGDVNRRYWEFRHDTRAVFKWKALIAVGLTDAQLMEFLAYPITSVRFAPSRMSNPILPRTRHGHEGPDVMDVPATANWSWIFDREDGSWIALEPGLAGKKMMFQIGARADHPRHTGIVPTPRCPPGASRDLFNEASVERVWERRLAILYGGLEEDVWRRHIVEELSSGRFMPIVEFRHNGWFNDDPLAATIDGWMVWEFELASGNPYAEDLPPIQIPSGATAIVQPLDSAQPSLTQTPALAADSEEEHLLNLRPPILPRGATAIEQGPGPWELGYSSGSEEEPLLYLDDESAMGDLGYIGDGRTTTDFLGRRLLRRDLPNGFFEWILPSTTSPHPLIHPQGEPQDGQWGQQSAQWQERTLVTSPRGSITGWRWQGSQD